MYEVTIAMPLYNAGKYLAATLETALNQSFGSIEYLIADDCSTDNSMEIIRQLQEHHPRGKDIRVVSHSKNQGVATARNTLLKACSGKYLFFLDSDDRVTPDCIRTLYQAAEAEKAEVTYGSYREEWENESKPGTDFVLPRQVFCGTDQLAAYANRNLHQTLRSFVWNVLYSTSFLRTSGVTFQPVSVWEDLLFYVDLIPLVKSAVFVPEITYIYIKREGSLSHYHARQHIPLQEIMEHIQIREYCKAQCMQLTRKSYFEKLMTKTMKICLDTAAVANEKRTMFVPPLPATEIKRLLKHPLHLQAALKMKQYRLFNTAICLLNNLPGGALTMLLSMYTNVLKAYRK